MADPDVKVIPGALGAVLRYGPIIAFAVGVRRVALVALRASVREAAAAEDPVAALVDALADHGDVEGFAAVVLGAVSPTSVLHGDMDIHVESQLGVTHFNARTATGVVREPLSSTCTRVRLGSEDAEDAEGLDLEAGVVPGDGVVILMSAIQVPAAPPAPAVRSARTMASKVVDLPVDVQKYASAVVRGVAKDGVDDLEHAPPVVEFESVLLTGPRRPPPAASQDRRALPIATLRPSPTANTEVDPSRRPVPGADVARVRGLKCGRGHFNHPHAANCAWCGLAMLQVSRVLVEGERPPLGVLVIDEEATFTLDADYVIGRQPGNDPEVNGDSVRQIVLDDPQRSVSRVHARVRLDGWDVVVADNGSANGTWVLRPDRAQWPERLPPHSRRPLRPGETLRIGSHALTFYSHHLR